MVLVALTMLASSCGGGGSGSVATRSPSPTSSPSASTPSAESSPPASPAPSPVASTGAYGVLVTPPSGGQYTVTLVGVDGKVAASAQASSPATVTCAGTAAAVVPLPVSTSNSRLYYMDAQGEVRTLAPDGTASQGPVINLPAPTASRRSMFAVSPDDGQIAVVVDDFTQGGATTRLYMDQLQLGGSQNLIFSESGSYTLWPIGWHGTTNLVLAKVPSCTQGGGPFCCGPQELHVVDPATANRRFTLGGSGCVVAGTPTTAGVACEDSTFTHVRAINWTGGVSYDFQIQNAAPAYVLPDGNGIAIVRNGETDILVGTQLKMQACGFIDQHHLLAGGDAQQQPRIGDLLTGNIVPVAAEGDCGGAIPGGL